MSFQAASNGRGDGPPPACYAFDDFVLDAERRVLLRDGRPVALTPKAFDTLLALVKRSGRLVSKDELLGAVWPDTFIEEATLAQNVFTVRKALGARADGGAYIETVPRHGYRFAVAVRELAGAAIARESSPQAPQPAAALIAPACEPPVAAELPVVAIAASPRVEPPRRSWVLAGVLAAVVGAAVVVTIGARRNPRAPVPLAFEPQRVERLTSDGGARRAAVSQGGSYVAFVRAEADGKQGLWLRQAAASTLVPVVPPAEVDFAGLAFAPDDGSIVYALYPHGEPVASLYEVPLLGGTPRRLLRDADSAPAFSPDGRRLAFVRNDPVQRASLLMIANRDGGGERVLARSAGRRVFSTEGLAWSPDAETVACAVRDVDAGGRFMTVVDVSLRDGRERTLTAHRWAEVGQVSWPSEGAGLIVDAWDPRESALARSLWEISVRGGATRRLTHDLADYAGTSVTADGRALVSVQRTQSSATWVATLAAPERAIRITDGGGDPHAESLGLSWTADGRLLLGSVASGNVDVWLMNSDGSGRRQLTADPAPDYKPVEAPDGRVLFASWRGGQSHVWDLDLGSGEQRELSRGRVDTYPQVLAGGRSIVYVSLGADGRPALWRAARDGSGAAPLAARSSTLPAPSPHGDAIAAFSRERADGPMRLAVLPLPIGGAAAAPRFFDLPPTAFVPAGLQWTPDGRAVVYVETRGEVSNLIRQPLEGGPATPLTRFFEQRIFRFAISPRGDLALTRGSEVDDVVLLSARDHYDSEASAAAL